MERGGAGSIYYLIQDAQCRLKLPAETSNWSRVKLNKLYKFHLAYILSF